MAVVQTQQQFFRAVGGLMVLFNSGGPKLELCRQFCSQVLRQVGHLVERFRPAGEQPLTNLFGTVCATARRILS